MDLASPAVSGTSVYANGLKDKIIGQQRMSRAKEIFPRATGSAALF